MATVVAIGGRGDDERAAAADGRSSTTTAADTVKVTTRDLVQTTDLDGTLGYGETSDLVARWRRHGHRARRRPARSSTAAVT